MNPIKKIYILFYIVLTTLFFGFLINLIISIQSLKNINAINKSGKLITAIVISEEQNNFASKSFRYKLSYYYDNNEFKEYERGIHKAGYFSVGQKLDIVIDKDNPRKFYTIDDVKYKNTFIISFVLFILFLIVLIKRKKIIHFLFEISGLSDE